MHDINLKINLEDIRANVIHRDTHLLNDEENRESRVHEIAGRIYVHMALAENIKTVVFCDEEGGAHGSYVVKNETRPSGDTLQAEASRMFERAWRYAEKEAFTD